MGNDRNRQQAIALKAADARALIKTLPGLHESLTSAQIEQIQKVLDAVVVNPVIQREGDDIYRRSVTAQIGNQVNRDPAMVRTADKVYERMIRVSEKDRHIRLDFNKLLTPDALTPRTDNPDEAAYLGMVKNTLASKGVWLRIGQPWVRDPEDPSAHLKDPRVFELWFSLGYDGDVIPTKDGKIDREELLETVMLGAGYYKAVHTGPVQTTLDRQIKRLEIEIEDGLREHDRLIERYRDAFPGVAEISDTLGGADLPGRSIWDHPHKLIVNALELNVGGNVLGAQAYLVVAAIVTRNAAQLLAEYAEKSMRGAGRAITVLKVAKTAGEIAEIGLAITGVGAGVRVIRGGAKVATGAARNSSIDAAAEQLANRYAAKNQLSAADLATTRWVPQPKGSVAGGVKPGTSSGAGTGFHKW